MMVGVRDNISVVWSDITAAVFPFALFIILFLVGVCYTGGFKLTC
jgi:hypothetical protein